MKLEPGNQVGKYEILAPLGSGGMGVVWKARDASLERNVALKTLPDGLAGDPGRQARLEREARSLATLNHPNVAQIHGICRAEGASFLELELVEGETLHDVLLRGPLPIRTVLKVADQIAAGLEAAHASGIVHRDLKPANVMLTPAGTVKLLDFGLSTPATEGDRRRSPHGQSPTLTAGTAIEGTPAYMSPEQARGEATDKQTDVWAFGSLLFEMLTGRTPFASSTPAQTLANVSDASPDFSALPRHIPASLQRLLRRCLARERDVRLRDIGDARLDIVEAMAEIAADGSVAVLAAPAARKRRYTIGVGSAAALAIFVAGVLPRLMAPYAAPSERMTFSAGASLPRTIVVSGDRVVAVSPDGSRVAYNVGGDVMLQTVGRDDATRLASGVQPFFSADGEWVGLLSGESLHKVSVHDRVPIRIATLQGQRVLGAAWHDDTIVVATQTGLYRTPAAAEVDELELLLPSPQDATFGWPDFLPDGRSVLTTVLSGNSIRQAYIARFDLETRELSEPLIRGAVGGRFVSSDWGNGESIVYATEDNRLVFRRVDSGAGRVDSEPIAIADLAVHIAGTYLAAAFDVADNGTIAHVEPGAGVAGYLALLDLQGREQRVDGTPLGRILAYPRFSPDGTRISFDLDAGTPNRRIWSLDLASGVPDQVSDIGDGGAIYEDFQGVWHPDGNRLCFTSMRTGAYQVWCKNTESPEPDELLVADPAVRVPLAWTPDGRLVVMGGAYNAADIGLVDPANSNAIEWLVASPFSETLASVSPDGKWLAYASNETGRYEIYVRAIDGGGASLRVTRNGGAHPTWAPDGKGDLYFIARDPVGAAAMMTVTLGFEPRPHVSSSERALFTNPNLELWVAGGGLRPYDVSPRDGRLVLLANDYADDFVMNVWLTLNALPQTSR